MKEFTNLNDLSHYLAFEALKYLAKNGPTMPAKEVYEYIQNHVKSLKASSDFDANYEGHDSPKFITAMNFKMVGFSKAGWLKKSSPKAGYWTITSSGVELVDSGKSYEDVAKISHEKYHEWKKSQSATTTTTTTVEPQDEAISPMTVRGKIYTLDPYEFQDLTAGLLEGMGYFIDFNAPRGKDGGVDLVCYRDPLGAEIPRIKVQCKHMPDSKIGRAEISQFAGVINSDEIGIFVTSGFYTNDAKRYAMERNVRIRLIDGQELEDMWAKYYYKIPSEKQALLPIKFTPELLIEDE